MWEFVFAMYDPDGMFLEAVDFFKICSIGTSPGYISVINVGMYKWIPNITLIGISFSDSA